MINITNLRITLNKDQRILVDDLNLQINTGDRIAIIGEEGNGKSSVLKAIADAGSLEDYAVFKMSGNILKSKIEYVSQTLDLDSLTKTVYEYLTSKLELDLIDYGLMHSLTDTLKGIDPFDNADREIGSLSGGERIKFRIVCALVNKPDLLIFDEPTNDMDIESISALEKILIEKDTPVIFVSHDEEFLNNVSNKVVHIELLKHKQESRVTVSNLGYSKYIEWRQQTLVKQSQDFVNDQKTFAAKEEKYQKLHAKVEHQLRSVSRQDPGTAKNLKDKMRSIKSMGKRFEKEKAGLTQKVVLEDVSAFKMNDVTLYNHKEILNITIPILSIEDRVLAKDISLKIYGPEKVVIIGENGVGKSTLLKRLIKEIPAGLKYHYLAQDFIEALPKDQSAIDNLSATGDKEEVTQIRTLLGSLNFTAEEMVDKISNLSGGQLIKLSFEKMRRSNASVLFLDEPTRNLSPLTRPVMVQAIRDFKGAVIGISHDRDFIKKCFDTIYRLDKDGLEEVSKESI